MRTLRLSLLATGCAAALAAGAQVSAAPPASGGNFTPLPGTPGSAAPAASTGGMCAAPQGGATCGGAGPASPGNVSGVNIGAGNPINVTNGNKFQMEVDLPALPGELGIEIVRYYNSANRHVVGQFGMGWRLSYESDLYVVGQSVQILLADGGRLTFTIDPKNPSLCAGADPAQGWVEIISTGRGGKEYLWHWTHGEAAGRTLRFDARGKLVQITAASGAVLAITRGPKGELIKVTDPQGRTLAFNHGGAASVRAAERQRQADAALRDGAGGDGLTHSAPRLAVFTGIQSIDSPVGRFSYAHGASANSNADAAGSAPQIELARAQAANLVQVSLPTHVETEQSAHAWANRPASTSAIRRRYHYEDARHPQALTGISVVGSGSDGELLDVRLSTYRYDERGRAVLSVRGEPTAGAQKDARTGDDAKHHAASGIEQVQLRILEPALPTRPGRTLLTNSLGQQTLYTHQIIAGEYRLLKAVGAGCASCGPVNLRWSYDQAGRLIEQTALTPVQVKAGKPQGKPEPIVGTRHVSTAGGSKSLRIEQVAYVAGKAQPATLVERQEYADSRWPDKPTLIAKPSVVAGHEYQIALTYNAAGQVTEFTERGWSPLGAENEIAAAPEQATLLERSTRYAYRQINGRSVLTAVDGPLPNGPANTPADSDITTLEWDARGSFITAVTAPGGLRSDLTHNAATGLLERVVNDAGFATTFAYNPQQQPTRIGSQGPDGSAPQVQRLHYDALGRPVQRFEGDAAGGGARPAERWAWDAQGRLLWGASALGILQTRRYDGEGQVLESTLRSASMAKTLRTIYDEFGRPTGQQDNAGRTRRVSYGADGAPRTYTDALGRSIGGAPAAPGARDGRQPAEAAARGKAVKATKPGGSRAGRAATPSSASTSPWPQTVRDDFGRNVLTMSPDSGITRRLFDAADRLVGMTDAQGNQARYAYDVQGRIREQTVTDAMGEPGAPAAASAVTRWRYDKRRLLEVIHPTQSERFEYDRRGLKSARIVIRGNPLALDGSSAAPMTAITRYEHDVAGELVASTLPDGSRIRYERNGQGQVVVLKRQTVQTPWLRWLANEQTIARDFQRDLVGIERYVSGNGIEARFDRSATGELARVRYRHPAPAALLQAGAGAVPQRTARSTAESIERMLGITPARGGTLTATPAASEDGRRRPDALSLPHDPQALIDHRYLWSAEGHLLLAEQNAGAPGGRIRRSYAWDAAGRLVASVQAGLEPAVGSAGSAAVSLGDTTETAPGGRVGPEQRAWRYAYDRLSRRVLSQATASQSDLAGATRQSRFESGSHRLHSAGESGAARYNRNGQPERLAGRDYVWDALGRLTEVNAQGQPIARYRYDHRGLRIARQVSTADGQSAVSHMLYDESRQPLAELDASGRITRQYVWVADLPLAVIDAPDGHGAALAGNPSAFEQISADLRRIVHGWFGKGERIAWLHTNHLGAPEAATDAHGIILWRASYAPFGAATVISNRAPGDAPFTLDLRLPGQVFDAETGLHYNRQRYYDPELGQYLTPDPLGTPDGPNPYAYVAFNPQGFVDPDGLVLFAFDGTGNADGQFGPLGPGSAVSNVVRFRDGYQDEGGFKYVTGVATDHKDGKYKDIIAADYSEHVLPLGLGPKVPDRGGNYSGPARIDRMMLYFVDAAEAFDDGKAMDIDIVGFSRGAAEARDFANRLVSMLAGGDMIRYQKHNADGTPREENGKPVMACQRVNFRFMGLFDTVLSSNFSGTSYSLAIPAQFAHVAHAVALNEYRSSGPAGEQAWWKAPFRNFPAWDYTRIHLPERDHYGGFPLQSIGASSSTPGQVRIELGFIGAHSDIGGGYPDGSTLSDVALSWMIRQATDAGVQMDPFTIDMAGSAIIHDQSNAIRAGNPNSVQDGQYAIEVKNPAAGELGLPSTTTHHFPVDDRDVRGAASGSTQRIMGFSDSAATGGATSLVNADTHRFIAYDDRGLDPNGVPVAQSTLPSNEIPALQEERGPGVLWEDGGRKGDGHPCSSAGHCNRTGVVDMQSYLEWLHDNGYQFAR